MSENKRLNADWYNKRIKQNRIIKKFLLGIINSYKKKNFPWSQAALKELKYEDLLEIATAVVNRKIHITLGAKSDYSNGGDSKFSIVRKYNYGKGYAALITGCASKKHILACVYENIQNKFYFFSFPAKLKEHSIPFDKVTGEP